MIKVKVGVAASVAPRILTRMSTLGELEGRDLRFLLTTTDEITRVELLEEGIRNTLLHFGKPELIIEGKVHVFRGQSRSTSMALAMFCRDEDIQILYTDDPDPVLKTIAPNTIVLVMV